MANEPTKEELQDQAREAGLAVSGTKDELKDRLASVEADDRDAEVGTRPAVRSEATNEADRMAQRATDGEPIQEGKTL